VQAEEVKRYTFVVQVHPEGISTLENLSTQERVRIAELGEVGPHIERWLDEAALNPSSRRGNPDRRPQPLG
jgi:hypothetical protein